MKKAEEIALRAALVDMRAALADMLGGWRYIRATHGDLYGVGWDRAQDKAERALGLEHGACVPVDVLRRDPNTLT